MASLHSDTLMMFPKLDMFSHHPQGILISRECSLPKRSSSAAWYSVPLAQQHRHSSCSPPLPPSPGYSLTHHFPLLPHSLSFLGCWIVRHGIRLSSPVQALMSSSPLKTRLHGHHVQGAFGDGSGLEVSQHAPRPCPATPRLLI